MGIDAISGNDSKTSELYQMMLKMMEQSSPSGVNTEKAINEMVEVLTKVGLTISGNFTSPIASGNKGTKPITSGPDLKTSGNSKTMTTENLEKLIALMEMENTDKQIQNSKERIKANQAEISSRHDEQAKKIEESIDKAREAEKQKKRRKLFGWLFAIVAVVVAVVSCVATGGAATAPIVGAVLAVGSAIATQCDAMEKLQEAIMKSLMDDGMSRKDAMALSAGIMIALSLAIMVTTAILTGGASAAEDFETVMNVLKAISVGMSAVSAGASLNSTITNKEAADAQIDTTLLNKILQQLQQRMEEENEELQELLEQMQSLVSGLASLIETDTRASDEIVAKLGALGV